jgi:tetratricopeptide (TPR) repeat protein
MSATGPGRALWEAAQQQLRDGNVPAAKATLESLLKLDTRHFSAHLLLVDICLAQGRVRAATEHAKSAAAALPNDADLIGRAAQCLVKVGETNAARICLQHPEIARTRSAPALTALALVYQSLGLHKDALALMERARELGLNTPRFRYCRAIQLQFNGRIAEAEAELDAYLAQDPAFGRASVTLARLRRWTPEHNHLDYIARRLGEVTPGSEDEACLQFAQYKELEDLGRFDQAWDALQRGNAIMHARRRPQPTTEQAMIDAVIARCTPEFLQPGTHRFDGPMPIFIVGMPRSGTTLLERVLGNHSLVTPAGELSDFTLQWHWAADPHGQEGAGDGRTTAVDFVELGQRYLEQTQWRAKGKPFYVDKLPQNYLLAGFIRRALPQAHIVHMSREPMDLCFSNYRALFGKAYGYCYDFSSLAAHHNQYRRLMRHWHAAMPGAIHDVSYEALVSDTETTARKLLAYCGLEFEPQCLDTASNKTPTATLSTNQVREPIHRRGLQEWRPYERQLEPLRQALLREQ